MKTKALACALLALLLGALQPAARADTVSYQFAGRYFGAAGTAQDFTGSFSISDPMAASRPFEAPDPAWYAASTWVGSSSFFSGAGDLVVDFASGTRLSSSTLAIVVNNTSFQGSGAPYPQGLSVQLYAQDLTVQAPTRKVCATPTGACGEDDDPLYRDANQARLMLTDGLYLAFYGAPQASYTTGVPLLTDYFGPSTSGLGLRSGPSTQLVGLSALSATVTASPLQPDPVSAVPEPSSAALLMAGGLALLLGARSQQRQLRRAEGA